MAVIYEPSGPLEAIVALLVGLVICFAGYRLATSLAGFASFLAGFALGFMGGTLLGGPVAGLVVGLIAGALAAILAHFALRLLAAFIAGSLAATIALAFDLSTWLVVLAAIVVGAIGLFAHAIVLAVASALLGAILATAAGLALLRVAGVDLARDEMAFLVGVVLLTALGIVAQVRAVRREG